MSITKNLSLYLFPILFLLIISINPFNIDPLVNRMIAVVILMAGWWISEAVPIGITSLTPVFLFPLLGILDGGTTSEQYFNDIIFLYIGGFTLSLAIEKWDLHLKIAYRILLFFGSKPYRILLGFMAASSFLSMWMSNTATAVLMLPIAISVLRELESIHGKEKTKKFKIALLLGVAYACSIGGIATLIGTPPNLAFVAIFQNLYPSAPEISFSTWFLFAIPIFLLMFFIASLVLHFLFPLKITNQGTFKQYIREENNKLGRINFEQKIVLILFALFAFLLIFKNDLKIGQLYIPGWNNLFSNPKFIKDGSIAVLIATLLFMIPSKEKKGAMLMNWSTVLKLPWGIILLFGGGFALAKGSVESGLTQWLGDGLVSVSNMPIPIFIGVNTALMAFLTEFTSNISTTQILLPVIGALSESLLLNPLLLMIPVTLAASMAFMLPIATPPNAIIFGSKLLRIRDMILPGLILNLTGIIVITLATYYWGIFIFEIDISVFPDWAVRSTTP